jgi:mannosylglycerate hydrolase
MEKVKKAVKDLPVLEGERRTPKVRTGRVHLYSDVLSNRTRMKRFNARMEDLLQRWAEPYATLAWCLGAEYPTTLLDRAWKNLLQGHAHDSIAGSGVDDIELDMTHRLRQVNNISNGLARRSLGYLQSEIDNSSCNQNDVLVTAFNASPYPRSEVLTVVLDIPPACASREFSFIEADTGNHVPVQMVTRKPDHVVVDNPGDAAHTMQCERAVCHFEGRKIPPLGYATYLLNPEGTFERGGLIRGQNEMENEHLHVKINPDGTLTIGHRATGTIYEGLHYFEDGGEAGQAWMHVEPGIDSVLTGHGFPVAISQEENGPLLARFRIEYRMSVPVDLDNSGSNEWERLDGFDNSACRTEETRELVVRSTVTLRKGAFGVEVKTRFHNSAQRHRLRVMFPTRLSSAKTCHAESAFDVVERPVKPGPDSPWCGVGRRTYPMQRFVDVSDGTAGLAIVNDGLREYEVTADPERTIAVTLLRAYQVSICSSAAGWEIHPEMKLSQSLGDHEFGYFIYPHAGRWDEGEVHREVERLTVPIQLAQAGPHGGHLPQRQSFLEIKPTNLLLSALKQSEDGNALLLRIYNPTEERIEGKLKFFRKLKSVEEVTLEELPICKVKARGKTLKVRVESRKIATLRIELEPFPMA